MQIAGSVVVVTGAARGIGRALASRFVDEGAATTVVVDRDGEALAAAAETMGAWALQADVGSEAEVARVIEAVQARCGTIDLYCSNAGIAYLDETDSSNEVWQRCWQVNVMAHVYASRALLPDWLARGRGYLLVTASAAGLLSQIGSASYAVTKHAAVAFAEYLAISYGDRGVGVSVLCPQAVQTEMIAGLPEGGVAGVDGVLPPEAVAESVVEALSTRSFLILPHPRVLEYFQRKANDYDRWLKGMQRLRARQA